MAASVRTFVVSWKEAAERKDSVAKRGLGDTHEDQGLRRQLQIRLARVDAGLDLGIGVVKLEDIDNGAAEERGIAGILDADLAHHLTDDDLDVLIVDIDALLAVHGQNALRQVFLHGLDAGNTQHVMRVERAVGDGVALAHALCRARPSGRRSTGPDRA